MLRRVIALLFVISLLMPAAARPANASDTTPLVISEIMTGGINESSAEDGQIEFIELHNQTADELDVAGWKVEYFAAARMDVTDPTSLPTSSREVTLDGKIEGFGYILLAHHGKISDADVYFGEDDTSTGGWLAKTGGHVRIVNPVVPEVVDRVGWGTTSGTKQPETTVIAAPAVGSSIQRLTSTENPDVLIDTDDNSQDFVELPVPTPQGGALIMPEVVPPGDSETPGETEEPTETEEPAVYYSIIITELLPDPMAPKTDSEDEFVELYNPQPFEVNIDGYILYTGSTTSTYKYILPDLILQPGQYLALYARDTNLTLVNTTGYAWITDPAGTLLHETHWYSNIGSDKSWIWLDGSWQVTNVLTPSAVNVALQITEEINEEDEDDTPAACPAGKYRNPATNRCKNIETEATLVACKPGQVRNPETNRCRAVVGTASGVLAPCKPGQERNPATNRCRNIAGITTTLKPCQDGYERNPETNRCRKVQPTLASAEVAEAKDDLELATKVNYAVLSFVSVAALGYGSYEYRHDFLNAWHRLLKKISKTKLK